VDTTSGSVEGGPAALRHTLHQRGLRMTPQRQLVLDAVRDLGHATPEQICTQVQQAAPAVNITTVYRTLDLMDGLAERLLAESDFALDPSHVALSGQCRDCRDAEAEQ
jgi:Fur family ferric uptake transcriptional regulator